MFEFLAEIKEDWQRLRLLKACLGNLKTLKKCIRKYPEYLNNSDWNDADSEDDEEIIVNPLGTTVRHGSVDCLKALLEAGVDIEWHDNYKRKTALILAAEYGKTECLNALLAGGANKEAKDRYGATALIQAVVTGNTECLKALADAGAAIDARNSEGYTALMLAAKKGDLESLKILLTAGADTTIRGYHGKFILTASEIAQKEGHLNCIPLFETAKMGKLHRPEKAAAPVAEAIIPEPAVAQAMPDSVADAPQQRISKEQLKKLQTIRHKLRKFERPDELGRTPRGRS